MKTYIVKINDDKDLDIIVTDSNRHVLLTEGSYHVLDAKGLLKEVKELLSAKDEETKEKRVKYAESLLEKLDFDELVLNDIECRG